MLNKNTEKYNKFAARNGVAIPIIQRLTYREQM